MLVLAHLIVEHLSGLDHIGFPPSPTKGILAVSPAGPFHASVMKHILGLARLGLLLSILSAFAIPCERASAMLCAQLVVDAQSVSLLLTVYHGDLVKTALPDYVTQGKSRKWRTAG